MTLKTFSMAKAKTFDKRRKSIKNIRKITRTMELISTARFKRAMDRAIAARPIQSESINWWETCAQRLAGLASPLAAAPGNKKRDLAGLNGQSRAVRRI